MNRATLRRIANAGLLSLGVAALGACSAESPAAPTDAPSLGFIPGGTGTADNNTLQTEHFKVCKVYVGTAGPDATIRVQVDEGNNGSQEHDFNVSVGDGECVWVWSTGGNLGSTDLVTVTETALPGYTTALVKNTLEDGVTTLGSSVASNTTSQTMTNPTGTGVDGVVVTFTNTEIPSGGCTLTQGYWKTHSLAGPAPYDDGWLEIGPLGSGETFFTSGMTWLEIFNTPPSGGNAYLQLAHQYMAAKLNIENGASTTTAVDLAIAGAEAYFAGKPAGVITETNAATKTQIKGWASTLAQYNEGGIGPGHCNGGGI